MLKNFIAYFRHHRAERNGALTLLVIMFLIIIGTHIFTLFYTPPVKDTSELVALIDSLEKVHASASANGELDEKTEGITLELFDFDPNTITDEEYKKLGFSDKEINTLRNYQKSGAVFRSKADFKKLYFLDDERFEKLYPFIDLPEKLSKKEYVAGNKQPTTSENNRVKWSDTSATEEYVFNPIICDLNRADTNELKKLPYIGSYFARQIIKYRNELGGYHTLAQLLEIYKMSPETIDKIADKVTIDTEVVKKIPINTATAQELASHPYISFALANAIVLYRESNGKFENIEKLCKSNLVNDGLCVKLAPYLSFI